MHKRIDTELAGYEKTKEDNSYEFKKINEEIEKLKEAVANKPCVTHDVIKTEIEYIKEKQEKHAKIFWWVGTLILTLIIAAVIKSVFKQRRTKWLLKY